MQSIDTIIDHEPGFIKRLQRYAQQKPDMLAYTFLDRHHQQHLSFAQLYHQVRSLASGLQPHIDNGQRILLAIPPCLEFPVALLACFYLGAIAVPFYIPINHQFSSEVMEKIIADAGIKTIITTQNLQPNIKQHAFAQSLNCLDIHQLFASHANIEMSPHEIALLLYTSGSTGDPKGVIVTHRNLLHNMLQFQRHDQLDENDIILTWLPNSPVAGLYTRLFGLVLGAHTLIFPTLHFLQTPLLWLEYISKYKVTFSAAPNFAYDLCSQLATTASLESLQLHSWKLAVSGGEIIRFNTIHNFVKAFHPYGFSMEQFYPYYGSTEGLCITIGQWPHQIKCVSVDRTQLATQHIHFVAEKHQHSLTFVSNGKPFAETTLRIVDPQTHTLCDEHTIGEVWVSGLGNTQGYWQKPQYSDKTCHAYLDEEGPFYRTGDLGFCHNGELYITGRLKELIILNGKNFYPEDIELSALNNTPDFVVSAAAFSLDIDDKERLIVVLGCKSHNTTSQIQQLLNTLHKVYSHKHGIRVYGFIVVADEDIPRASTRKIKRSVCRHYYESGRFSLWSAPQERTSNFSGLISLTSTFTPQRQLSKNLKDFIGDVLQVNLASISNDVPLHTFGIDSISMVKILTQLNKHFQVQIPHAVFFDDTSLSQLAKIILDQYAQNGTTTVIPKIDFRDELQQVRDICKNLPDTTAQRNQNIFLTGATGFLGSYLLYDLLTTSHYQKIYCLVRAENQQQAYERIQRSLPRWQPSFAQKLHVVVGCVDKEYLGLTRDDFFTLAKQVDLIIHNAANVNFVAPYHYLRDVNVGSCLHILRLATTFTLKPIHFVSTLAVFNSPQRPLQVTEQPAVSDVATLYSGYAQSKWVAEKILQQAQSYGVALSIYRPGIITGDRDSGYVNVDDFLCRFIKGCVQKQAFPKMDIEIDMTPVDYVSQSIVALLNKPPQIYHLANPAPIKLTSYAQWLQKYGYRLKLVDFVTWLDILQQDMHDNALFPVLPFVTEKHPVNHQTILQFFDKKSLGYSCVNTTTNLPQHIFCKAIDEDLLTLYIKYMQKIAFLA